MKQPWKNPDAVALRAAINKIGEARFKEILDSACPARVTVADADKASDQIANKALIRSGWDQAVVYIFSDLALFNESGGNESGFSDMSSKD